MWCTAAEPSGLLDPYHINSAEPEGDDVLMSFRHLNAVYSVRKTNGSVEWKIGGTTAPESLTVLNDPIFTAGGGFLGQHDVRDLPDGTHHAARQRLRRGRRTMRQARAVRYVARPERPHGHAGGAEERPGHDSHRALLRQLAQAARRQLADGMGQRRHHHRAQSGRQQDLRPHLGRRAVLLPVSPRALRGGQPHGPASRDGRAVSARAMSAPWARARDGSPSSPPTGSACHRTAHMVRPSPRPRAAHRPERRTS